MWNGMNLSTERPNERTVCVCAKFKALFSIYHFYWCAEANACVAYDCVRARAPLCGVYRFRRNIIHIVQPLTNNEPRCDRRRKTMKIQSRRLNRIEEALKKRKQNTGINQVNWCFVCRAANQRPSNSCIGDQTLLTLYHLCDGKGPVHNAWNHSAQ